MGKLNFSYQYEFNFAASQLDDNANLRCRLLTLMTYNSSSMIIFVVNFPDCLDFTNFSEGVVSFGVSNIGISMVA